MCLLCAVTSCSSFIIFFPPFLFLSFPFFLFFFPSRSLGPGNQIHRRRHAVAWPKGTPTAPMARWVRIYVLSPPHDRDLVLFARLISSTAADRYSLACPLSLFPFSRWPPRLSALRVHLEHRLHATRAPFQRPLRASESVPFPPSVCVSCSPTAWETRLRSRLRNAYETSGKYEYYAATAPLSPSLSLFSPLPTS